MNGFRGFDISQIISAVSTAYNGLDRTKVRPNDGVLVADKTKVTTPAMIGIGLAALAVVALVIYTKKHK